MARANPLLALLAVVVAAASPVGGGYFGAQLGSTLSAAMRIEAQAVPFLASIALLSALFGVSSALSFRGADRQFGPQVAVAPVAPVARFIGAVLLPAVVVCSPLLIGALAFAVGFGGQVSSPVTGAAALLCVFVVPAAGAVVVTESLIALAHREPRGGIALVVLGGLWAGFGVVADASLVGGPVVAALGAFRDPSPGLAILNGGLTLAASVLAVVMCAHRPIGPRWTTVVRAHHRLPHAAWRVHLSTGLRVLVRRPELRQHVLVVVGSVPLAMFVLSRATHSPVAGVSGMAAVFGVLGSSAVMLAAFSVGHGAGWLLRVVPGRQRPAVTSWMAAAGLLGTVTATVAVLPAALAAGVAPADLVDPVLLLLLLSGPALISSALCPLGTERGQAISYALFSMTAAGGMATVQVLIRADVLGSDRAAAVVAGVGGLLAALWFAPQIRRGSTG